jgi:hypothetical protein
MVTVKRNTEIGDEDKTKLDSYKHRLKVKTLRNKTR